jgi:hypothetical protein
MTLADETWVVTEGIAGMENQCLGLAERLPLPVRTFRIEQARVCSRHGHGFSSPAAARAFRFPAL